ncbi:tail fiber assembly protein [Photorhabdus akhurstii]|uniref:tail fiber assembly protein n=1 Tax=Photorhabdus akhurstii TaxID=171438 RepID=UPI003704AD7A
MSKYETELALATFDENGIAQTAGWIQVYSAFPNTREFFSASMISVDQGEYIRPEVYLDAPAQPESLEHGIYRSEDGKSWEYRLDGRGQRQYQIELPIAQFDNDVVTVSGWTKVYLTHASTKMLGYKEYLEYKGVGMSFVLTGIGLDVNAFLDKPTLPATPDTAICRSEDNKSWIHVPDFRGKTAYDRQTGSPVIIRELGELSSELTWLKPTTPIDEWDGERWVTNTEKLRKYNESLRQERLDGAKQQIAKLEQEVQLKIQAWELYGVKLMEVDIFSPDIQWPEQPK